MTFYKYINENIDRIRSEIRMGLITTSILRHWEIYSRYDYYKRVGNNVLSAVDYTANDMRISKRGVFRIVKRMESNL
jgi:hypothetical protein